MTSVERDDRFSGLLEAKSRGDTDYLIRALVDSDYRGQAATFLGQLKAVEATEPLLRLLDANDPLVRIDAARALGWIGAEEARPRLRDLALDDESDGVRSWVIGALGDIGDPDDLDFLVPLLGDGSVRVRGAAALALGRLGDPRAIEPLLAARRRLRRSPGEWYLHRKGYNKAIATLRKGPREEKRFRFPWWLSGVFLVAGYYVLRLYVGFWWAIVLIVLGAIVVVSLRALGVITREATSPPP